MAKEALFENRRILFLKKAYRFFHCGISFFSKRYMLFFVKMTLLSKMGILRLARCPQIISNRFLEVSVVLILAL